MTRLARALGTVALATAALAAGTSHASAQVSFSGPTNFPVGDFPSLLATADFNEDGNFDLATSNEDSRDVSLLYGNGAGGFSAPRNYPTSGRAQMVEVGFFNPDLHADIAVPNYDGGVMVRFGNGRGAFSTADFFAAGANPISATAGDFTGDRKDDLAIANQGSNNVSILRGDGQGHFSKPTNFAAGSGPNAIESADFNHDNRLDLAVPNRDSGDVSILLGLGKGKFATPVNLPAGTLTFQVAVGDFNNDSNPDLAVANFFSSASVFLGNGAGGFSSPTHFEGGNGPNSVQSADLDRDGNLDLVFTSFNPEPGFGTSTVWVFRGDGTGAFAGPFKFGANNGANQVAIGSFNGDSGLDLAVTNLFSDDVSVLLNTTPGTGPAYRDIVLADSPRGYWRLDQPSWRKPALDSSPFGNHGTYALHTPLRAPGAVSSTPNTAMGVFDGNDGAYAPDSPSLRTGDNFTGELWLKRRRTSRPGTFLVKDFQLFLHDDGTLVLRKPAKGEIARSTVRITDVTTYHHVAVTKSGPDVHLYIDGRDVTGPVTPRTITDSGSPLRIGYGPGGFRGVSDEAAVYGYALSPAQVARHYIFGR